MRASLRGLIVSLTAAAAALSFAAPGLAGASPAPHAAAGAAYSDPVYYPVHDPVMVGCVTTNCPHADHKGFAINLDSSAADRNRSDVGVYAAGAGILHVGTTHPALCGQNSSSGVGNWVWIDHGGGVVSEYLHLKVGSIPVRSGGYVRAGQRIGTMGNTGDSHCGVDYLDFSVRQGGIHGATVPISTLLACQGSQAVRYPGAVTTASTWVRVPYKTQITSSPSAACLPPANPSPATPGGTSLKAHGTTATLSWSAPAASEHVTSAQVQLEMYHPSTHGYGYPAYRTLPSAATSATFTGLRAHSTYRAVVSVHDSTGWSHPSHALSVTIG